jgi:nitric oxide reductase large subunit
LTFRRSFPAISCAAGICGLAILWIATAYVGGALFVASMLGRSAPPGQRRPINLLFVAIAVVALGSLLGEWAGNTRPRGAILTGGSSSASS